MGLAMKKRMDVDSIVKTQIKRGVCAMVIITGGK
jgi:hypothetical protein